MDITRIKNIVTIQVDKLFRNKQDLTFINVVCVVKTKEIWDEKIYYVFVIFNNDIIGKCLQRWLNIVK